MDIKSYNRLSLELRKSVGLNYFKHKLKLCSLDRPFYTLHEFLVQGKE
jgi:hypothetical protein